MNYFDKARQFVVDSFKKSGSIQGLRHFDRTVYWIERLRPDADESLKIAAVAHDLERAFRDPSKEPANESSAGFKDDFFLKYHPEKGAEIMGNFLEEERAPKEMIERVKMLISKHEVGGDEDQNLLKDADSISYFENQIDHFITKRAEATSPEKVKAKFDWMYDRITSEKAKEIARPMYEEAVKKLSKLL